MAQTNPRGRFDYLFDDLTEPDEDLGYDGRGLDAYARELVPWYRTTPAVLAMVAITVAVVAIVVCAVLLVSRHSRGPGNTTRPPASATSTTVATTPPTSAPPPPPPPPASSPPEPTETPSAVIVPTNPPRVPPKPPQTGVNLTPITRMPISVQPAPHPAFPRY
ncbi:hypothetical protein [Mycobacterium sp.]|uniref:hypothetical protein n=1 Tax=Mycobacterium sp. TaxID=1785 RepID=UPI002B6E04CE|nr:hypothetical protein [Mycobacterium sp.]HME47782.1 hypothetical protein [Mycobacterium sp.]